MTDPKRSPLRKLVTESVSCCYYSLPAAIAGNSDLAGLAHQPLSLRILAENLLRHSGVPDVDAGMLEALARGERGF